MRVHTAPPLPPFIHCAHDSLQPPLETPDQLSDTGAAASQVSEAGLPNCCISGTGADESFDDVPLLPPAVKLTAPVVQSPPVGLNTSWPPLPLVTVKVFEALFAINVPLPVAVVVPTVNDPPDALLTVMTSPIPAENELGDADRGPAVQLTVTVTGAAVAGEASAMGVASATATRSVVTDRRMRSFLGGWLINPPFGH